MELGRGVEVEVASLLPLLAERVILISIVEVGTTVMVILVSDTEMDEVV